MCDATEKLADVIRHQAGLTGTKVACGQGQCGSLFGDPERQGRALVHDDHEARAGRIADHDHRGHRHARQAPRPAARLDPPRRRPVRLLLARVHRLVQGAARPEPRPDPRRDPRLVAEARQRVPLHRLQAAGRRRHRRRQGAARRDERETSSSTRCPTTATSGTRASRGRRPSPRSPARSTTAPTTSSRCRPARCTAPSSTRRCRTPTCSPSTSPRPRRCRASSRSSRTRTSRAGTASTASSCTPTTSRPTAGSGRSSATPRCSSTATPWPSSAPTRTEQALAAVPKVKVELEELPAYMNALDAMADDAIEIYPGTPNIFFTQQLIKGEDTEEIFENGGARGRGQVLPAAPAPPLLRAGLRLRLHRRRGSSDDPLIIQRECHKS